MDYRGAGLSKVYAKDDPWDYFKQARPRATAGIKPRKPAVANSKAPADVAGSWIEQEHIRCIEALSLFCGPPDWPPAI
jgi:hypothetical protein